MLHVFIGSLSPRIYNVQPEKYLPLKSSAALVGMTASRAKIFNAKKMAQNKTAMDFMRGINHKAAKRPRNFKRANPNAFARVQKSSWEKSRSNIQWDFSRCKPISCTASRGVRCAKHSQA